MTQRQPTEDEIRRTKETERRLAEALAKRKEANQKAPQSDN